MIWTGGVGVARHLASPAARPGARPRWWRRQAPARDQRRSGRCGLSDPLDRLDLGLPPPAGAASWSRSPGARRWPEAAPGPARRAVTAISWASRSIAHLRPRGGVRRRWGRGSRWPPRAAGRARWPRPRGSARARGAVVEPRPPSGAHDPCRRAGVAQPAVHAGGRRRRDEPRGGRRALHGGRHPVATAQGRKHPAHEGGAQGHETRGTRATR